MALMTQGTRPVLVTGAAGFVGRGIVLGLLGRGWPVRGLIRTMVPGALPRNRNLELVFGDVRDLAALQRATEGVGAVVHCAGVNDQPDSHAINVGGARNLVEACRRAHVSRVVNISTLSVKLPRKGPYAETKAEADAVLAASGLDVTTLRCSVIYGEDRGGVFGTLERFVRSLPVVPVIGDGSWRSRPIYLGDVSRAVLECLQREQTVGKVYDLGGEEEVALDDLIDRIAREYGVQRRKLHVPMALGLGAARVLTRVMAKPPVTVSNVLGSNQDVPCDSEPAYRDLGLTPLALREGLPAVLRGAKGPHRVDAPGLGLVKVGIVGLGKMGLFHGAVLQRVSGARVVGLVDVNPGLCRTAQSMGLRVPAYSSLEAMAEREDVDAVFVCTPTYAHRDVAIACMARGLDVFVEKPLAPTLPDTVTLCRVARATQSVTSVGYLLAYAPTFLKAADLLKADVLGRPRRYVGSMFHSEVLGPKRGWLFDRAKSGGGVLMNPGSHLLSVIYSLFGCPTEANGDARSIHSGVDDEVTAVLCHPGGLEGRVECSWSVPGKPTPEFTLFVGGENGTLTVTPQDIVTELEEGRGGLPAGRHRIHISDIWPEKTFIISPEAGGNAYFAEDERFIECCIQRSLAPTSFEMALGVERIIDAIYRSARAGRGVTLAEEAADG
jgi:predicted dehydrogenase/nucleoside-diphosphate-sugar epimerase